MFTDKNRKELQDRGFTVVNDVMTSADCDSCVAEYEKWLSNFKDGSWPRTNHSLIHMYGIGHFNASWQARLKARDVFAQVWGTSKLLTSVDAVAIGRPPEDGIERFAEDGQHWLHTDQDSERRGIHAYQGAVYLAPADQDDWTFQVMERSHLFVEQIFDNNLKAAMKSSTNKIYHVTDDDKEWLLSKDCSITRVPAPKGSMVLWDSRLVHANARPIKGRKNPGRWRYVVMVCMAPAIWSTPEDMKMKKTAYRQASMTTHWPCTNVQVMSCKKNFNDDHLKYWLQELPKIAKTKEAKQLCGAVQYDFHNGKSNGPEWTPVWNRFSGPPKKPKPNLRFWCGLALLALITLIIATAFENYRSISKLF